VTRVRPAPSRVLLTALTLTTAVAWATAPSTPGESKGGLAGVVAPRLEWIRETGAESCVAAADLSRLLLQVLGEDAAPWALGDSVIEGLVAKGEAETTWRARIRIVSPTGSILGQRELSTRQPLCSSITPSVLLVLLMLVDPQAADRGLPTQVVEEISSQGDAEADARTPAPALATPAPAPTPPPARLSPAAPQSPTPQRSSQAPAIRGWRLHVEPTVTIGLLPSATLGLSGGVSLVTRDDWQLALSASYRGRSRSDVHTSYTQDGGIVFSAVSADLSVCPSLVQGSTASLSGCVGATFVRRWTETPALAVHTNPSQNNLGPSVGMETRVVLTKHWHLRAHAGAAMPIPRDHFVYEDNLGGKHSAYDPSLLFGSLGLGLCAEL
jgi:hypothetical protein